MKTEMPSSPFDLDDAFIQRLEELCAFIGTKKQAAQIAGVSEDMLHRYIRGDSRPSLLPIAKLCAYTGKSMDWLLFNQTHAKSTSAQSTHAKHGIRMDIMEEVIEVTEEWLLEHGDKVTPKKKALLMREVYEELLEKVTHDEDNGNNTHPKGDFGLRKLYSKFKSLIRMATA